MLKEPILFPSKVETGSVSDYVEGEIFDKNKNKSVEKTENLEVYTEETNKN